MFKPNARPVISAPNVIPMADVMLVLLVIFMVITPMIRRGAPVRMANAQNAEKIPSADRDDAIIVAVTRDGNFFLSPGNREVTLTALSSDVKDLVAGRLDKTVYVRSDARAKYGDVVKAVDQIRAIGIENIGISPKRPRTNRRPFRQPAH